MPTTTPLMKVDRTKSYGAEVVLYGNVYDEAAAHAAKLAAEHGYTFIHPFLDDPAVATRTGRHHRHGDHQRTADGGTVSSVPVGGGGLAAGVSTLAKLSNPKIKVIGVEPAGANCLQASLAAGKPVTLPSVSTIADGTAVKTPGKEIFPYLQKGAGRCDYGRGRRADRCFPRYRGEPQADRGEFGTLDSGGAQASGRDGQKNRFGAQRRQYGHYHHVLRRAARAHQAEPDLYGIGAAAGTSRASWSESLPSSRRRTAMSSSWNTTSS